MSSDILPRRHRHTRSAVIPSPTASSQNPQNPHHLNVQAHTRQSEIHTNNAVAMAQPSTPPRTPRRNNTLAFQNNANLSANENGSKQKSRNRNRPKNVITSSPAAARKDRKSPPQTGPQSAGFPSTKPINTPTTAAYAGPTFRASPAPSALPIPSFYSKSVPESPSMKGLRALKDSPSPSQLSTPPPIEASTKKFQREESPLDIFFNADRAEKERAQSAVSSQTCSNGPFNPVAGSPTTSQTPPATQNQTRPQRNQSKRVSTGGMFAMEELDGEDDSEVSFGPAFSTPYSERISAARSANQSSQFSTPKSSATQQSSSQNMDALKAYLFSDAPPLSPPATTSTLGSPYQPHHAYRGPRNALLPQRSQYNNNSFSSDSKTPNMPRSSVRSSGLRQEVTPTKTPTRTPDRSNSHAQLNNCVQNSKNPSEITDYDRIFGSFNAAPLPTSSCGSPSVEAVSDVHEAEEKLRRILGISDMGKSRMLAAGVHQ